MPQRTDAIARADVLLTQLEIPLDTVERALQLAKQHDVLTLLNPAPVPATPLSQSLLRLVDYLTPNETELDAMSGEAEPSAALVEKGRRLLASKTQALVVTLGAAGAQRITHRESARIPSYEVRAVDTTGAGDAFNAGLAVGLAEGKDGDEAIRLAHATAALSVTKPGTTPSMPTRAEVEAFLKRQ